MALDEFYDRTEVVSCCRNTRMQLLLNAPVADVGVTLTCSSVAKLIPSERCASGHGT